MDQEKMGGLIRALRREQGMTQLALAGRLGVSDKAVSKWERGLGCPDVSLLPLLSSLLGVGMEGLLSGQIIPQEAVGGNMRKLTFFVCPSCGNLLTATGEGDISCCGKKLAPLEVKKPEEGEKLQVELIENEYFISSDHPMTKDHFVPFVAFLTGDTLILRKLYPEWNLETRLPRLAHGQLLWYCTEHGLFGQRL